MVVVGGGEVVEVGGGEGVEVGGGEGVEVGGGEGGKGQKVRSVLGKSENNK